MRRPGVRKAPTGRDIPGQRLNPKAKVLRGQGWGSKLPQGKRQQAAALQRPLRRLYVALREIGLRRGVDAPPPWLCRFARNWVATGTGCPYALFVSLCEKLGCAGGQKTFSPCFCCQLCLSEARYGVREQSSRFGCGSLLPQGMFRSWRCTVADVMEFRDAPPWVRGTLINASPARTRHKPELQRLLKN